MRVLLIKIWLVITFCIYISNMNAQMPNNNETSVKYYKKWEVGKLYRHPIILSDEIKEEECNQHDVYLKAQYENQQLIAVEKIYKNKLIFKYEYFYKDNKLYQAKSNDRIINIKQ